MAAATETPVEISFRQRTTATLSFPWWDRGTKGNSNDYWKK